MIFVPSHKMLSFLNVLLPQNPVIVEAGAFWGHDSLKMADQWPQGTVHAFEPVPDIFDELAKRTSHMPNIKCHKKALSAVDGFLPLHLAYKKNRMTQASSLHEPYERLAKSAITFPEIITVPTISLKSFMHKEAISTIDLLWLDLQGHEYTVLSHALELLPFINVIHMEVYFIKAYKDHLLYYDIVQWLEKYNFLLVAKDFKNETDNFFGNIVCVKK